MKRTLAVIVLAVLAALCLAIYGSVHFTYHARRLAGDPEASLRALKSAKALFPFLHETHEQAGRVHLQKALDGLSDIDAAKASLRNARASLRRALTLNPGSAPARFDYAKVLDVMAYLGMAGEREAFAEYKKAAQLAGYHPQFDAEIGKTLLGRWGMLSEEEKGFAADLLRRGLLTNNLTLLREIFNLWDLNSRDYDLMESILPPSSILYGAYAQFLGERSLSLEERQKMLARAEDLDFEQARAQYADGQRALEYGQDEEAVRSMTASLALLRTIKFYGKFVEARERALTPDSFTLLHKNVVLDLAKTKLELGRNLAEAEDLLRTYLGLESNFDQVVALDKFLKEARVIPEASGGQASFKDIRQLAFEVFLMFNLHKYRQIIDVGNRLQASVLMVDKSMNGPLSEILQLIGDSYLKLDFVYEPEGFYRRALELTPQNPEILSRLRKYYERRNEEAKLREVDALLDKLQTHGELLPKGRSLDKGEALTLPIVAVWKNARLTVELEPGPQGLDPLLAVFLDGRVIRDGYVDGPVLTLDLESQSIKSELQLVSFNRGVNLKSVALTPSLASR